ncbi:MAG: T9SS type A sorting domain-containing protein [Ignavibacteria bacterium]
MKKLIFLLTLTLLIFSASTAQNIPFTNTIRIYDLDTGGVMRFYKIPLPQEGYKNFYVQRSGYASPPYVYDMRLGNVYKYIYSLNGFSDTAHYWRFHNSWSFQYGYYIGYLLDVAFSRQDTNLFIYAYRGANWEPADFTAISFNNGLTTNEFIPGSLLNWCGGMAIDPVNDSIMYVGYSAQFMVGNVHKTTNRGANWFCTDTIPEGIYYSRFFINTFNRNTIFARLYSTLYRSTTGGTDFQLIRTGIPNVQIYFDDSENAIYMCNTSAEGLLKSTNNGTNWTVLMNKAVNDIEFDPLNNNVIYAGCDDGLYKSSNKGNTWSIYNNTFSPDLNVRGIVKNPNTGDTLYVSTNKAVYKVFGKSVADTSVTNYFPMAVGNIYVYEESSIYPPFTSRSKVSITKDSMVDGQRYYHFSPSLPGFNQYGNWYRVNSATGVVTALANNYTYNYLVNERYVDSLGSKKGDNLLKCGQNLSQCYDTTNFSVFGIPTKQKTFKEDGLMIIYRTYSKNFGVTQVTTWEITSSTTNLVGCRLNGITYGDTLLTGAESISSEVPDSYSLGQNFPNPFNPRTVISFQLPAVSDVMIKVYDVQGRELQTLVNEKINPGTYETTFDGSNYSSGVYFYKLQTKNFTETKRMLLLK